MKRWITLLACGIWALLQPSATAQQLHYWSDDRKIPFSIDKRKAIIGFSEQQPGSQTFLLKQYASVLDKIEPRSEDKVLVLHFKQEMSGNELDKLADGVNTGFATIQYYGFGYTLDGGGSLFPTNRIAYQAKAGTSTDKIKALLTPIRVQIDEQAHIITLETAKTDGLIEIANKIYESKLVEYCHPDFIADIVFFNDPLYPEQYYLNNTGQLGGTADVDINAPEAWQVTTGSNPVTVAVIDQGVEAHEDLTGRVLPGFTVLNPAGRGAPSGTKNAHGVACAGIIAATHNNTLGIRGIAPNARILPVNIFNGAPASTDLANAINWAWQNGADVLSNSWGFEECGVFLDNIRQAITNARTLGRGGLGCVVVVAAGNTGGCVTFPATVGGVITVGAVDKNGNVWGYSARGPRIDLVAPSGNVNLTGDVRTTDRMGTNGYEPGAYTNRFGGTSAACPQVAGVAALLLSDNPALRESHIGCHLVRMATDMGPRGYDIFFGNGRLNAYDALAGNVRNKAIGGREVYEGTNYLISENFSVLPAGQVTFRSEKEIRLEPGFQAIEGSTFLADLASYSCEDGANRFRVALASDNNTPVANASKSESALLSDFRVYPNPNQGQMTITYVLHKASQVEIVLVDVLGKVLPNSIQSSYQVVGPHEIKEHLIGVPSGVYSCQVRIDNHQIYQQKIIVSR